MKKIKNNILAEGEVTGHYHKAIGRGVAVVEDYNGKRTLAAPNGAKITHQEHKTILLPPGEYDRYIVKEFDHAAEEARNVRD